MYLYDKNMVATTKHKYVDSSNFYIIIMVQNLKKKFKIENFECFRIKYMSLPMFPLRYIVSLGGNSSERSFRTSPRGTKCRVESNNNREAVAVCARHVVKRPHKRSALVLVIFLRNISFISHYLH